MSFRLILLMLLLLSLLFEKVDNNFFEDVVLKLNVHWFNGISLKQENGWWFLKIAENMNLQTSFSEKKSIERINIHIFLNHDIVLKENVRRNGLVFFSSKFWISKLIHVLSIAREKNREDFFRKGIFWKG